MTKYAFFLFALATSSFSRTAEEATAAANTSTTQPEILFEVTMLMGKPYEVTEIGRTSITEKNASNIKEAKAHLQHIYHAKDVEIFPNYGRPNSYTANMTWYPELLAQTKARELTGKKIRHQGDAAYRLEYGNSQWKPREKTQKTNHNFSKHV